MRALSIVVKEILQFCRRSRLQQRQHQLWHRGIFSKYFRYSEQNLEDSHHQLFGREDSEQQRQQWSCCGHCQASHIVEAERNRTHVAYKRVAVAEVGKRLNVGGSEKILGRRRIAGDPFPLKPFDIVLRELAVLGQAVPFCACHLRSEHEERRENRQHEKG